VQPLQSTEKDYRRLGHDITALLVHDHGEHLAKFEESLRLHKVELTHARTCPEACQAIQQDSPPLMIFTDTRLSDGTFQDILKLAAQAEKFVNVLVVSKVGSTTLYMEAMQHGAFDFFTPTSNRPASPLSSSLPQQMPWTGVAGSRRKAWRPFSRKPPIAEAVSPHTQGAPCLGKLNWIRSRVPQIFGASSSARSRFCPRLLPWSGYPSP